MLQKREISKTTGIFALKFKFCFQKEFHSKTEQTKRLLTPTHVLPGLETALSSGGLLAPREPFQTCTVTSIIDHKA